MTMIARLSASYAWDQQGTYLYNASEPRGVSKGLTGSHNIRHESCTQHSTPLTKSMHRLGSCTPLSCLGSSDYH